MDTISLEYKKGPSEERPVNRWENNPYCSSSLLLTATAVLVSVAEALALAEALLLWQAALLCFICEQQEGLAASLAQQLIF